MTTPVKITLSFNLATADSANQYGPTRLMRLTPHGKTAALFPPDFAYESGAISTMPLAESLSIAALNLCDIARHAGHAPADIVDFIDARGHTHKITAARFTPH